MMSQGSRPTLPSLNALRTFEATVRCGSMTQAAHELCVTHGAVSRQVKALEASMGVTLLVRSARSAQPTPEGMRLAEELANAFGAMAAAVERVQPGPLVLSCSSSITTCWLIPRIAAFYQQNPGIELALDLNYNRVDFARDNVVVAIRNSTIERPRNAVIRDLGTEWIGPVCAPQHAKAAPDWAAVPRLATKTRPGAWADWLAVTGATHRNAASQRLLDHFYLVVQAAACGLGVAVVPRMLVMEDLRCGRLVAPLGFVPGLRELSLWIAPHSSERRDVKALEQWLLTETKTLLSAR